MNESAKSNTEQHDIFAAQKNRWNQEVIMLASNFNEIKKGDLKREIERALWKL